GLTVFMLVAAAASGLRIQSAAVQFDWAPALASLYYLSRLMMIMLIGFALLSGIPPLRLKQALDQGLSLLRRIRVPIEPFAWTAALMVRFIPVLLQEWNRFSLIAAARGKFTFKPGRVPLK